MLSSKSAEEIRYLLDEYGIKHGPVVESTRPLYEKKLREAMAKHRRPKPQSDRTYYREETDDVTYVYRGRPEQNNFVYERAQPDYRWRDYTDETPINRTQVSYHNVSQTRNWPPESESQKPSESNSTRMVPVWLQILVFLIVCGLLYLVFINMEPAEPIKRLT